MSDRAIALGRSMFAEGLSPSEMNLARDVGATLWGLSHRNSHRTVLLFGYQGEREVLDITTVADANVVRHLRAYCIENDIEDLGVDAILIRIGEQRGGLQFWADGRIFVGRAEAYLAGTNPTFRTMRLIDALGLKDVAWFVDDIMARLNQSIEDAVLRTVVGP